MIKTFFAGAAAVALGMAAMSPAFAQTKLTQAQCETLWTQALAGSSGDLAMNKAKPFVKDFKKADQNSDAKLSQTEWVNACNQGWIQSSASTGAGSGASGTSDRTPGGASDRSPGASDTGAAGTEKGKTPGGTSDRTPGNQ